jgi:tetratricopeptide (TPR) repeat protein
MELLHYRVVHLGRHRRPQALMFRPARADWLQAGAVAAALFVIYAATAPRSVGLEDDALFVLSSYFLGIEHPPGYPIFTLIGHLFTQLPFGSVAYRVHLASALFGALTGAAAWLCARSLAPGRAPAYLAALALGVSPVFWSQSVIAEVYTLNTLFFLALVYLGLRAEHDRRMLPWMAFVFGLSLSNHYPLMLLAAPAFAVLLWPLRQEILRRIGLLVILVVAGLAPYAWLIHRSWKALPISFYGELETLTEIWYFISRSGYADVDRSATAGLLDKLSYVTFIGSQLFVQFALVGTAIAAAGFAAQWRMLGGRIGAFLTIAFLMPSVGLALLLGFDYDLFRKHMFHVYPLPAYAVVALWLGLGFAWLTQRYTPGRTRALAAGAVLAALLAVNGAYYNLRSEHDWAARYAQTLLEVLPRNAVVFGQGDADLMPLAYYHIVENRRPDITLYQAKGLILGNRLFHALRTHKTASERLLAEFIAQQSDPVVFTLDAYTGNARRDRWLYVEVDKSSTDFSQITVDIPEEAMRFFEESVAQARPDNAWIAYFQSELRRRYGILIGQSLARGQPPSDERGRRHLELLGRDFYGALGVAEGLLSNKAGFSDGAVAAYLDRARELLPSDAPKQHLAGFFQLRGVLRANTQDRPGAIRDLETAYSLWPTPENGALQTLELLYRDAGDQSALQDLQNRVARHKQPRH